MIAMDNKTILELRELYLRVGSAAEVFKSIAGSNAAFTTHKLELVKQIRAAFNLSLGQASPIGGWAPDGTGELSDSRLDSLLVPAIESTRSSWDNR